MSRSTAEGWAAQSRINDAKAFAAGKHILSLYDIRGHWVISPYFVASAMNESQHTSPDLFESIAIIGDRLTITIIGGVVRRLTPKGRQSVALFTQEDEALRWLDERVKMFGVEVYKAEQLS